MSEKQIKKWLKNVIPNDYDKIDTSAHYDSGLTHQENKEGFKKLIQPLLSLSQVSVLKERVEQNKADFERVKAEEKKCPDLIERKYEYHKYSNIFPLMNDEGLRELKEDIKKNGLIKPITLYEGKILDGRNRYEACLKVGVEPAFETYKSSDPIGYVISLNVKRRHLTSSQLAIIAVDSEVLLEEESKAKERQKEHGNTAPGKKKTLVVLIPQAIEEKGKTRDKIAKLFGISGKYVSEAKRIKRDLPKEYPKIRKSILEGGKSIPEVKKEIKKEQREKRRQELADKASGLKPSEGCEVIQGEFQEKTESIEDNSIDHILTDPPYNKEGLSSYEDLSKVAKRVLKPGGFCIVYAGAYYLDKVFEYLSKHLTYYYQCILLHNGPTIISHQRNLSTHYKSILVFQKPLANGKLRAQTNPIADVIRGTGREKDIHVWQQSLGECKDIIEKFTEPNDLILDVCGGSGTTAIACLETQRRCIIVEKEEEDYEIIKGRIQEYLEKTKKGGEK